jgi:hypothetical protein
MPWPRAAEDRVRQLATRRSLRMRGTHRRTRSADDYGYYQLIDANGQAVTPFWPLDRVEEYLTGLRHKQPWLKIGQIKVPPYQKGEAIGVTP